MALQVLIQELPIGTPFKHVRDVATQDIQPERLFRIVAFRKSTALVENGVGVRTTMSKRTPVLSLSQEVWDKVARPAIAAPLEAPAERERKAAG